MRKSSSSSSTSLGSVHKPEAPTMFFHPLLFPPPVCVGISLSVMSPFSTPLHLLYPFIPSHQLFPFSLSLPSLLNLQQIGLHAIHPKSHSRTVSAVAHVFYMGEQLYQRFLISIYRVRRHACRRPCKQTHAEYATI